MGEQLTPRATFGGTHMLNVPPFSFSCQCLLLEIFVTKNYDLPMKKGSNCMLLDPFILSYGGAGVH
jgi:hypothetical protein